MLRLTSVAIALLFTPLAIGRSSHGEEPTTLLGRVTPWQYPGSNIRGAMMSDAETLNAKGERRVPSIQCKTVMTTTDPISKVVDYYRSHLKQGPFPDTAKPEDRPVTDSARSVTFHSDSENRPLALHIIHVNTDQTSTVLVITRAEGESQTHIAWTQYEQF